MKPRLLFINQYYFPDLASTGQLMTQLCESLSDQFDVTVLTGFPSYSVQNAHGWKLFKRETINGVRVVRVFSTTFPRKFLPLRAINYFSYFFSSLVASLLIKKPDVVVAQTDPPFIGLVAVLLKVVKRSPLCIVFQDVFPEVALALGKLSGMSVYILRRIRGVLLRTCDKAVVISQGMGDQLAQRGIDREKLSVIHNWIDTDLVTPQPMMNSFRERHFPQECFVVMHSGNIGFSQDFDVILDAAQQLRDEPLVQFVIVGDGAKRDWVADQVARRDLTNVMLLPYQPLSDLQYSLASADLHLVTLKPGLENFIVPSKIYGVLGASRPVIALVPERSEVYDIVRKFEVGQALKPGDHAGMVTAILQLMANRDDCQAMGRRGRQVVEQRYSRIVAAQAYAGLFGNMISR